ncbi:hypothetical protein Ctob_013404, partial [Chrysochromulina tobinii]
MSSTTSEPDANSAQALARSLKAPLNAVSLDAKLDVAVWLVAADERTCIFPDRLRFVLDWLCGVLRGAKAGSDGVPPRADVRFWRLLDALLHRAAGLPEPIDDAAPPAQLPRPLPSGFRTRLAQSSRLLLQSAAAALEHAAAGSMAPSASAHLCARVRRVSCLLLIEEASWFRPGAEAVAEYAGRVSQSAALLLEGSASPYATVREAMAAGAPHALHAAADASSAVAALTGETPPRKVLMILTGTLLRPMLALLSSCSRLFGSGADEEADDGGGAHHGATHSGSFRARDGASRALVCAAVDAAAVISESVRSILVHADHLPEYAATLRHSMPTPEAALSLGGSERTGAAGREISIAPSSSGSSSGKRAPKRAKAEAPSGGGGSANYTAATLEAIARFTRDDLQSAPARALSRALAAASAAGAPVAIALLATAPSLSRAALGLLHTLLGTAAAERQRAQALATALTPALGTAPTVGAHHSAARSEDDGYREAAAMLLWRAGVALERGCSELLEPGAWGLMRPTEPPAALVAARDALHRLSDTHGGGSAEGKGGRIGGGKGGARGVSASYADAAVQLAAADAVAYAAEWFHLDRVVMSTAGLFTPWGSSSPSSAPAEDDEDDPQGAAPAERAATVEGHKGPTQAGRKRRKGSSLAESVVAGAHEGAVAGAHDSAERLARRAAKRQKGVVVGAHESAKRQKVVRRWLKEDVALLATWRPAEAKLAATWTAAPAAAALAP